MIKFNNWQSGSFGSYYIRVNFKHLKVDQMQQTKIHNAMVKHRKFNMFNRLIIKIRFLNVIQYRLLRSLELMLNRKILKTKQPLCTNIC